MTDFNDMSNVAYRQDLDTYLDDIVSLVNELRADVIVMADAIDGILAKLDADATVTDTNYAALWGQGGSESNAWPADPTATAVSAPTNLA